MPAGRAKYNFYAVTNGREIGVYTNWPQAGDAVLGFANARYKGFGTYSDAAEAMLSAGFGNFIVYDGQNTYSKCDYEQSILKQVEVSELKTASKFTADDLSEEEDVQGCDTGDLNEPREVKQLAQHETVQNVYIDGSCVRNGAASAQAGIGLYWGEHHPWNNSISLKCDATPTNNKAELMAAIKAIQVAGGNNLKHLIINSDSKYVINGVTEWVQKWRTNGWKNANGENVKNKDEWTQLMTAIEANNIKITWQHVSAHSGIAGNEEADKLALQAAMRETTDVQPQVSKTETSSIKPINANEKPPTSNTQPQVIVIPRKMSDTCSAPKKLTVINVPTTPGRKPVKDKSETPVPGSVNGSFIIGKEKINKTDVKEKKDQNSATLESVDSKQIVKIIANFESVLQSVMFEVHQIKQQQLEFRSELKDQLNNTQSRQQEMQKSISTLSNELTMSVDRCHSEIKDLRHARVPEKSADKENDVSSDIASLQKKIDTNFDTARTSMQSVEKSVSTLKIGIDKVSKECRIEFQALDSKNNQLQESVTEFKRDMKSAKEAIKEMEKSLTVMTHHEEFMKPNKTVRTNVPVEDTSSYLTQNMYTELSEEDDEEVTFRNVESNEQHPIVITEETREQPQLNEIAEGQPVDDSAQNKKTITPSKVGEVTQESTNATQPNDDNTKEHNAETERRTTVPERDKVYLIGDSISGQVNQAVLGKSTRTFVKKLKAPTIQDINKVISQAKDAKLIIVHTGINNIRQIDSTDDRVVDMVTAIESLKEVAPDCEVIVSKPIPIGDRSLDIERNIFNARVEKKISENGKVTVSFLDHGNLSEQGVPIKSYYRQDLVHLAPDGIDVFASNLRRMIFQVLKKDNNNESMSNRKSRYREDNRVNNKWMDPRDIYYRSHDDSQYKDDNRRRDEPMNNHNTFFENSGGYHYRHHNNSKDGSANMYSKDGQMGQQRICTDLVDNRYGDENRINNESMGRQNRSFENDDYYHYRDDNRRNDKWMGHRDTYSWGRGDNRYTNDYRGNSEQMCHRNIYSGSRDGYHYRGDNRGNDERMGHRSVYARSHGGYHYRDDIRDNDEAMGHRRTYGSRGGYRYRDENRGDDKRMSHRHTYGSRGGY